MAAIRIRDALDCSVTIVAHIGWSPAAQERPKGLVDLPGAIDGATCCKKDGEGAAAWFQFKSVYQRHAADGFEQVAKLKEFGPDRVFVSAPLRAFKVDKLSADLQRCLAILRNLGDGTTEDLWREAVKGAGLWPNVKNWRSKWLDEKKKVLEAGIVEIEEGLVVLNDH